MIMRSSSALRLLAASLSISQDPSLGITIRRYPAPVMSTAAATTASTTTRTVRQVSELSAGDFQHPDDKRASDALSLLAPIEWAIRAGFSALVEDAVFMDNIATGVLVGPKQLPELHAMLIESCKLLGLKTVPDLYIRQSPYPNAYTLAIQGRRPFVVATTALLDLLEPLEIQAVLAHELGHLKCEHSLAIAMANLVLSPLANLSPIASAALQSNLLQWQRAAELSCDRAALLVVQDTRAVQGVTMKLCGGSATYAQRMDVDAFVQQATAYDEVAEGSRLGRMVRQSQQRDATHPLPIYRVRELQKYAESKEYAALLARGTPTAVDSRPMRQL
jgi:Zn-dependent protease with chaperone function